MKLIIGLWNPGKEYEKTRHNVWFMFLDYLKDKENFLDFKFESKFKADISEGRIWIEKIILIKPQTYMNLSGESIRKIFDFYKLDIEDIIVIYDDLSMNFWKLRFRDKWSAWWHNGIKNIIKHFWETFDRIKVWIWFNSNFEVSDWVLSKFSEEELIDLDSSIFKETLTLIKEKL